ncbi:hypothetical protein SAMN05444144_10338 [Flavobacterium akiainvivens]|nr:hypothetical protein SAMN05444144_10338 [Flavobacterium akiainvivens]
MPFARCLLLLATTLLLTGCTEKKLHNIRVEDLHDSLIVKSYVYEMLHENTDSIDYSLNTDSLMQELGIRDVYETVASAPDGKFRIFTLEAESCGAYCNASWYSWIRYNANGKMKSYPANINTVTSIHKIADNNYLVTDNSWGRPASVLTVECMSAKMVAFSGDSLTVTDIPYHNSNFQFCQENGVFESFPEEDTPYIRFNSKTEELEYCYANNYAYGYGKDIDTLRHGTFTYRNGTFVLKNEKVTVINHETE